MGNAPGSKPQKHHERRVPPPIRHCGRLTCSGGPAEVADVEVTCKYGRKQPRAEHRINGREPRIAGFERNPDRGVHQDRNAAHHPENAEKTAKSACGRNILVISSIGHNRLRNRRQTFPGWRPDHPSYLWQPYAAAPLHACPGGPRSQGRPRPALTTPYPACSDSSTSRGRMRWAARTGNAPFVCSEDTFCRLLRREGLPLWHCCKPGCRVHPVQGCGGRRRRRKKGMVGPPS